MSTFGCNCKYNCTVAAFVAALVIGVVTAFLQITGTITVTVPFLWVLFGIAVVYLGILLLTTAFSQYCVLRNCRCTTLNTVLIGILGTVLFTLILLAVGIVATSVISAILVGLLLFFFTLILTGTACMIRCRENCTNTD